MSSSADNAWLELVVIAVMITIRMSSRREKQTKGTWFSNVRSVLKLENIMDQTSSFCPY